MWGSKGQGSSLEKGVSHTYTTRVEFLSCKKKKISSLTACQEMHAATTEKPFALVHVSMSCRLPFPK